MTNCAMQGSATVPFRNVFNVEAEFLFSVDNPAFVVGKANEKLPAKKPVSINVSYKPDAAGKAATGGGGGGSAKVSSEKAAEGAAVAISRTGKLTVSCAKQTSIQWVFYLQA
eukprot:GHRR01034936.1.p1 GENE.GHRR01034936.1~~GHRR01034936.1.p1  ORF type:complete len:112 (-),score=51.53 GHRR01034936.1:166-501(-)